MVTYERDSYIEVFYSVKSIDCYQKGNVGDFNINNSLEVVWIRCKLENNSVYQPIGNDAYSTNAMQSIALVVQVKAIV